MTNFTASGMPSADTVYTVCTTTFEEARALMVANDLRKKLAAEAAYNTTIIELESRNSCANCIHNDAYVECENIRCIRLYNELPDKRRVIIKHEHILEIERNPNDTICAHHKRAPWRME